jgi:hypothetical protein
MVFYLETDAMTHRGTITAQDMTLLNEKKEDAHIGPVLSERVPSEGMGRSGQVPFLFAELPR